MAGHQLCFADLWPRERRGQFLSVSCHPCEPPTLAQQLDVINRQLDEAFNKHDAVAVAALFTTNATLVAPLGIVSGRDGVEKYFTDVFQRANPSDQVTKISYVLCLWWRFMRNWRAEFDYEPRAPDPRRGLSDTRVYPCARYLEDSCGSG
jgi:hypothetical protein